MNTEQSYENVAPGATAPQKTTLFNSDQTKVHVTCCMRDLLGNPADVHHLRSALRSWFLHYLSNPDDKLNPVPFEKNLLYYEQLDDYLAKVIELHFGFYIENVYSLTRAPQVPEKMIPMSSFLDRAQVLLTMQDNLADKIFAPAADEVAENASLKSQVEIQTGLRDCWKLLSEMIADFDSTISV